MRRPQQESSNDATRYQDDDRRRGPVERDEFSLTRARLRPGDRALRAGAAPARSPLRGGGCRLCAQRGDTGDAVDRLGPALEIYTRTGARAISDLKRAPARHEHRLPLRNLSCAQFEELSRDQQVPEFIDEVKRDRSHSLASMLGGK